MQKHEAVKETESKSLYLEAYSRGENIKFMNIEEGPQDQPEDTEKILRGFLEHKLGYEDVLNVELQRVHHTFPEAERRVKTFFTGTVLERIKVSNVLRPTD